MRVMILIKASPDTEAGVMPSGQLLTEMGLFNAQLVKAGVMVDGNGLRPSSEAARVHFNGGERSVTRGPFTPHLELITGYWIWQVASLDEAIDWVRRCPNPTGNQAEIEIRPLFEGEDFGKQLTPELRAQEQQLREQAASQPRAR